MTYNEHIPVAVENATPTPSVKPGLHYYALFTRIWELMMTLISAYNTSCSLFILIGATPTTSTTCKSAITLPPVYNKACIPFGYRNISAPTQYHCSLSCIYDSNCYATIYDATRHNCMFLEGRCLLLQPSPGLVYQTFKHECINWVPNTGDYAAYWFYEVGTIQIFIARTFHDGYLIVGKETQGHFYGVSCDGNSINKRSSYERLVVYPSCHVTWVDHDSTGQPAPAGVLIGGMLTLTNTPLYVVGLTAIGRSISRSFPGYLNPLNDLAWGELFGTRSMAQFEMLVVLPW